MHCPRCHGATDPTAARCPACGAPLVLPDEPAARRLDRDLSLDRRSGWTPGPPPLTEAMPARPAPTTASPLAAPRPPGPVPQAAVAAPQPTGTAPRPAGPAPHPTAPSPCVIELRRGGIGRRVLAWAVDGLPFALAAFTLVAGLGAGDLAVSAQLVAVPALASFAYQALAVALSGTMLGKRILRLRVVGRDGRRPGPGRSALRAVVAVTGTLLLGLGPLLALFTASGRGLHDLVAGTVVVDSP